MGKVRRVDLYPDEWLVGTAVLKPDERGCYITVCCLIYSYGEPILDHDHDLAKLCNTTVEKWRRIRESLLGRGKLRLVDGRLTNGRCETELKKALNRTQNAREIGGNGGRKSGETRRNQQRVSSENNDLHEPDASNKKKLTTNHQPPTKNLSLTGEMESIGQTPLGHDPSADEASLRSGDPQPTIPDPQRQDPDELFGEWWVHVPRKVSRGQAEKAYRVALKHAKPEELLAGIQRYAAQVADGDPRFIAHPATWLNGKRWLDEPALPLERSHVQSDQRPRRETAAETTARRREGLAAAVARRVGGA